MSSRATIPLPGWRTILLFAGLTLTCLVAGKSWTAPRVDPALVGEWVEEFERADGSYLDVAFESDGACTVGNHAEELLSSFIQLPFSDEWLPAEGVLIRRRRI